MIKFGPIIATDGSGYWSSTKAMVKCESLEIAYCNKERDFAELRIYFDTDTWDVYKEGLIYTDKQFLKELKGWLTEASLDANKVDYSEQGMQSANYVSLDVGKEFIDSLYEIAPEAFTVYTGG